MLRWRLQLKLYDEVIHLIMSRSGLAAENGPIECHSHIINRFALHLRKSCDSKCTGIWYHTMYTSHLLQDAQNLLDRLETDKSKAMKDEEHLAAVEEDLRQEESNLQKKVDVSASCSCMMHLSMAPVQVHALLT